MERLYARGLYPLVAATLRVLTGWMPFSLAEVLFGVGVLWTLWRVARGAAALAARRTGWRAAGKGAARVVACTGHLYLAFLVLWGLNYQRLPAASSLGLEVRPADARELEALSTALIGEADALREGLPENGEGAFRLAGGLRDALKRAALNAPGRPKPVALSPLLSYLGIAGIFVPFTGEANVNITLPDCQVPFSAGHELAHEAGFAREDEANYLGYLACRRHPDRDFRYSGVFVASRYATGALRRADRAAYARLERLRSPAVRRDIRALEAWHKRYESRAADLHQKVNDAYLRAQGDPEGARSYGRMVDLLLAERRASIRTSP